MRSVITLILLFFITPFLFSQSDYDKVVSTLNLNQVKGHMTFIASDELKGRDVGTDGFHTAGMYIKSQLISYGVDTAPGMDDYFQEVPLSTVHPPERGNIDVEGHTFDFPDDFVILGGENIESELPFIFYNFKENKDESLKKVKDKIVISVCGDGTSQNPQSWFYQSDEKKQILKAAGAKGLIELYQSNKVPYKFLKQQFVRKQITLEKINSDPFLHIWLSASEQSHVAPLKGKGTLNMKIEIPSQKAIMSRNVVGYVEGTDQKLKDEVIVYSAHYDHVGIGNPDSNQDSIYNGARDNGVGITAILEAARNIAKFPTKRSALFVFFTAEEKGLLGSKFFVENTPVDLDNIVYNLNIDNGGYNDTTIVTVVGLDRTTAGYNIQKACNLFGLEGIEDPAKEQGLFDRSDNVSFARKGIPAPTFSLGFRAFDAEIFKYYHQPSDGVESLNFNYLFKYFKAFVLASRNIANDEERPFWAKGDKYYQKGIELYKD